MQQEIIVGTMRRRYWPDAEKLSILEEIGVCGATVSDVARRHDLSRQHLYQWRAQLRRKGLLPPVSEEPVFLALPDPSDETPEGPMSPGFDGCVEIILSNGRVLKCRGQVTDEELVRMIRLVEAA
ncbi:MAG: transposase [Roseibium sp.]|uniref:transposase n=1 Tax=Roseibium sp. TaxID=1936156 RepID=UPI00261CDE3B|nr:transposase [Roseibium sp.]MCV0427923.1 transposase [Roseibium sp.]